MLPWETRRWVDFHDAYFRMVLGRMTHVASKVKISIAMVLLNWMDKKVHII